ncbi:transglutaminase-like cysteine peptidase [Aquabacterium sp. A7-Y]|uniref:transglutaminase-like cysteine peptidase n=1 Tax=Aquabacterium sp. A7-Y TaxID=1349605 RepID=UPI00223E2884|nr:transglutaminase-like cysteine peptidase [Aquabacterium sp. A7-Y]MCW7541967.1 transglutaminase-like cysteine peptidase [Aquabacterium sp. A7-Y]
MSSKAGFFVWCASRWLGGCLAGCLLLGLGWALAFDADRMLRSAERLGPAAVSGVRALQAELAALQAADERQKLQGVNQFFNRRQGFRDDHLVWGRLDHWASPLEFLQQGQGDCEDFAMAKYFTLLAVGTPAERMRLVYVRATIGGPGGTSQAHMVLAYYPTPQAEPLILDNLIGDIRPASRRPDLMPVFSFNAEGLWQGVGALSAGDPAARLSRWREVLAKAREEGFLP